MDTSSLSFDWSGKRALNSEQNICGLYVDCTFWYQFQHIVVKRLSGRENGVNVYAVVLCFGARHNKLNDIVKYTSCF